MRELEEHNIKEQRSTSLEKAAETRVKPASALVSERHPLARHCAQFP